MYLSKSNYFETFLGKDVPGQVIGWTYGHCSTNHTTECHSTNFKMVIKIFRLFYTPPRITEGGRSIKNIDKVELKDKDRSVTMIAACWNTTTPPYNTNWAVKWSDIHI